MSYHISFKLHLIIYLSDPLRNIFYSTLKRARRTTTWWLVILYNVISCTKEQHHTQWSLIDHLQPHIIPSSSLMLHKQPCTHTLLWYTGAEGMRGRCLVITDPWGPHPGSLHQQSSFPQFWVLHIILARIPVIAEHGVIWHNKWGGGWCWTTPRKLSFITMGLNARKTSLLIGVLGWAWCTDLPIWFHVAKEKAASYTQLNKHAPLSLTGFQQKCHAGDA